MLSNHPILCHPLLLLGAFCMQVITAREGPCQAGSPPECGLRTFGRRPCESQGETGKGGGVRYPWKSQPCPPCPPGNQHAPGSALCRPPGQAVPFLSHQSQANPVHLTGSAHKTAASLPSPASVFPSVEWVEVGGEPDPKMCRSLDRPSLQVS